MPIQLIVGLGNPGANYELTRHNAGTWFIERLLQNHNITLHHESRFHGAAGKFEGHHVLIPSTYMNESGRAVLAIAHFYKILPQDILVVHDELDLPPGIARLKQGGGHAGHNGLRDIINHLHSNDFWRLRLGIGHPGNKEDVSDYVLKQPSKSDQQAIEKSIDDALFVLPDFLQGKTAEAMQALHTE